jgi:hypothetical protein
LNQKKVLSTKTQESRVDVVIRLMALIILGFGGALVYYTYTNATAPGMAPSIVPVYYGVGILLFVVGLLGVVAKFR